MPVLCAPCLNGADVVLWHRIGMLAAIAGRHTLARLGWEQVCVGLAWNGTHTHTYQCTAVLVRRQDVLTIKALARNPYFLPSARPLLGLLARFGDEASFEARAERFASVVSFITHAAFK